MTLDQVIEQLQAARDKVGGTATLWANRGGDKWDEHKVESLSVVDDGESAYVQLVVRPES